MKVITIIIATYNAAKTLRRCLDSIVSQLTDECELVLVDGGSKDNTNAIIDSYSDKVSIHISEPDRGIYDAWNKGIKASSGEWIMFIGADDLLLPHAINNYLDSIKSTNQISSYDYICAHNEYVDEHGNLLKILGSAPEWSVMRKTMAAAHVASLHNRHNLFDTIGLYNLNFRICADYELLVRKRNHLKYLFIDNHIARMKIGGMSFSTPAVIEAYQIRKLHHTVSWIDNVLLLARDWLAFKCFVIRKSLWCYLWK
jgi:glycosyltransferase involved in cell wall biosynthesis